MNLIEMKRYIDKLAKLDTDLTVSKMQKAHFSFLKRFIKSADERIPWANQTNKTMNKTTLSLIAFLQKHPELRTWQAIRAWSGADFIFWNKMNKKTRKMDYFDTFYWEHKNK